MKTAKDYQRKFLRAPYRGEILFSDESYVFKAQTLNLSEGGMLLDKVGHFPEEEIVSFLIKIPQFPYFKNFSLEKLITFSPEVYTSKMMRLSAKLVRRFDMKSQVDEVFTSRIGLQFLNLDDKNRKIIADYVDVFVSNLIYFQILIDNLEEDETYLEKIRSMSDIFGYGRDIKLASLRKQISNDYKSLQWL